MLVYISLRDAITLLLHPHEIPANMHYSGKHPLLHERDSAGSRSLHSQNTQHALRRARMCIMRILSLHVVHCGNNRVHFPRLKHLAALTVIYTVPGTPPGLEIDILSSSERSFFRSESVTVGLPLHSRSALLAGCGAPGWGGAGAGGGCTHLDCYSTVY